ncbi:hypothetical protein [Lapillicoccus sp.]|uniref:hypothetical protein n=1 Tax=Lapillicoccus sp. TaxID=1909287 RepID=UPI0025F028C1|nr:hypothetical protein [Lapillicoccus sp.]
MQPSPHGVHGSSGYAVVADSLVRAAYDIAATATLVRQGTIEVSDDAVDVGHPGLASTLAEFTSRWQTGADALIRRQHDIVDRLGRVVESYLEQEAQAINGFSWVADRSGL